MRIDRSQSRLHILGVCVRKLLLKLEEDYASSVLWEDIPEDLFSTPVWVDGSPSTLGEERLHFM